jgi:hypothetical protein
MYTVLPLPVGPDHHSAKKATTQLNSFESDHEIRQNGIISLNLVEKMQALQQSWAEPCMYIQEVNRLRNFH